MELWGHEDLVNQLTSPGHQIWFLHVECGTNRGSKDSLGGGEKVLSSITRDFAASS